MPLSTATVTFDLSDHFGNDYDTRRGIRAWVDTNIPDDTIVDSDGNKVRIGSGKVTVADDGTGSFTVWVPGAGSNPASWQTKLHVEYVPNGNPRAGRTTRTFGPFTITGNADLADLIEEQEVPPTYLSVVTELLDGFVAEAEVAATTAAASATSAAASADAAATITGIDSTDSAVAALVETPAGPLTQAALSATFGARPNLTSTFRKPVWAAHRGGPSLYPEHSIEAYRASAAAGYALEVDLQSLNDGTVVCLHDSTVDRTMTGATGAANTLTPTQWRAARVKPAITGGRPGTPAFWTDVLAEFGGRVLIIAEIKTPIVPSERDAIFASITSRNLGKAIIIQSMDYATCLAAAAAGIEAMFISANTTESYWPAQFLAAGIRHLGVGTNVSDAAITSMAAGGLTVWAWTINTRALAATRLAAGATGIMTDDPWGVSGQFIPRQIERFDSGALWPLSKSAVGGTATIYLDPSVPSVHLGYTGTSAATAATRLGQFGEGPHAGRYRLGVKFGPAASAMDRWLGFYVGTIGGDGPFLDSGTASGADGYHFLMRRNGTVGIYRRDAVNGTANLLSNVDGTDFTTSTTTSSAELEFVVTIDTSGVTITCTQTGVTATAADTTHRGTAAILSLFANSTDVEVTSVRASR